MLMKWLIRLAFPALGFLVLLIFFGLGDPEKISGASAGEEPEPIPAFEGLLPSPIPTEGPEIVFKWQDTDGNWHYADQPPTQGPWNALAIEQPHPPGNSVLPDVETDWQTPYQAPFSLNGAPVNSGS
ncbi:MAG TPA: DUF4124 domain-containing protein [Marinobacter sp.]|jgi:hypothetical protein|nr:DUF4124 domain-containing protein [Marinobacter sp.]